MQKFVLYPALLLVLGGCVGPAKSLNVQAVSAPITGVEVVDTLPPGAAVIGEFTGTSCKNKIWDPSATESAALQQLQALAVARGAKGVARVTYSKEGTSLSTNCWEAIHAKGTLYS